MKIEVVVNLEHEATHYWPECPFDDVKYLKNNHRHVFKITAFKEVTSTERQIEILRFKKEIKQYIDKTFGSVFGRMSCENLALDLLRQFFLTKCQVLEDGENGAIITA